MNLPALQLKLADYVEEYEQKMVNIPAVIAEYEAATQKLLASCIIGETYGDRVDTRVPYDREIANSLLKSAWKRVYDRLQIDMIASAKDKNKFQSSFEKPAPFTLENIRATFGHYILDPRGNILRGLAEVFCDLDQAYKSHDKVRIGVKGLPKRVIISGLGEYSQYGRDKIRDILNAMAAYQGKSLTSYQEVNDLMKDGDSLKETRGVSLTRFKNGNGHLYFEPKELRDINMALAEYYGEVLPDCSEEKPQKKQAGTAVSKDLQYYPTPVEVVEKVLRDIHVRGDLVLEPSCGCGRFLDALRKDGADVFGIEYDAGRAAQAKAKGHSVLTANFLEVVPEPKYDRVVMNPPFYGKHYALHVNHAMKFLKPGGILTAILPATARYDHGLLDGRWWDLPVGSFSGSGTNINTTVLTMRKPE